jgi:hypothetical protein
VITLRKTARVILHEFHQNQSLSDPEQEKRNIIKTAANLIKSDIKSIESAKNEYPSVSDIESIVFCVIAAFNSYFFTSE